MADEEAGQRLDRVVAARTQLSRVDLRELFERGAVRREGRRARRGERVEAGEAIEVEQGAVLSVAAVPDADVQVEVAYEDDAVLVVHKPAGQASHPIRAGEVGCLANGLVARFPELEGVGYEPRQPGLVNRLDNDTSGLLLVARHRAAFESLRQTLTEGRILKRYVAACDELPDRHALRWSLAPDPGDPRRMVFEGERQGLEQARFQPTLSDVIREQVGPSGIFVTVQAQRAVRHQVRCHLAAAGAPLCGDALYGGRPLPSGRHLLHACELRFVHPLSGEEIEVKSEKPAWWRQELG